VSSTGVPEPSSEQSREITPVVDGRVRAGRPRRGPSRELAAATRAASGPSARLLLPPSSPARVELETRGAGWAPVAPDLRFAVGGRARPLQGYDEGLPPPTLPPGSPAAAIAVADVPDTLRWGLEAVARLEGDRWCVRQGLTTTAVASALERVLSWLVSFEGATWEQRWLASGADAAPQTLLQSWTRPEGALGGWRDSQARAAVAALLVARVVRPSYSWQLGWRTLGTVHHPFWLSNDPLMWQRLQRLPAWVQGVPRHRQQAQEALSRVMIRSGKQCADLRGEDLLHYADVVHTSGRSRREHLAWELLVALGPFADEAPTMRAAWSATGNSRRHSAATLVDRYGIASGPVRDLLVDYLGELRPGMNYSSLESVAYLLVRVFWRTVLTINPAQADLNLDAATAAAWRQAVETTTDGRPRRDVHTVLFTVRAMYRDLAEWAHDEPARWAPWVAACPVSRHESRRASIARRAQRSRSQARTRTLTPLLPALVAAAAAQKEFTEQVHAAALAVGPGQRFTVGTVQLQRRLDATKASNERAQLWAHLIDPDTGVAIAPAPTGWGGRVPPGMVAWPLPTSTLAPGAPRPAWVDRRLRIERGLVNVTRMVDDGFFAWAIVETLRLTGLRKEELFELTQLSLRHYTSPTGTLVPLLHVVPSKNDRERLIPMSPDLVAVLLAVQRRARALSDDGTVPLTIRYDQGEKQHGSPFPHLFVHRLGTRTEVLSNTVLIRLLRDLTVLGDLRDGDQPARFTPHDFRRLFTTELVGAGLPLHIAATLLGHLSIETTRGYTAVFPEQVIAAHEALIERRRRLRADAEMRPATDPEWTDFQEHFLRRKVSLGDCHRPYGTPCVHEHACVKCRFLAVDPAAGGRIEEMTANTCDRITEARDRGWLGELSALQDQLAALRRRTSEIGQLVSAQRRPGGVHDPGSRVDQ